MAYPLLCQSISLLSHTRRLSLTLRHFPSYLAEFRDMWAELKAPDEVDMIRQLVAAEMKPVSSEALPPPVAKGKKGQKKPRQRQRQAKITNTHLKGEIDLSRDYVPGQ